MISCPVCVAQSYPDDTGGVPGRVEDQLGSLGLVLNAVVLWTTRYIDAAVAHCGRFRGERTPDP